MADVVKLSDRRKKPPLNEVKQQPTSTPIAVPEKYGERVESALGKGMGLRVQNMIAARSVREKVHNLGVHHHPQKLRQLQAIAKDYSDEDLAVWLGVNATDSNLRGKPTFFHALADEAFDRGLRPLEPSP